MYCKYGDTAPNPLSEKLSTLKGEVESSSSAYNFKEK